MQSAGQQPDRPVVSLAVLLDNARGALAAARQAGVDTPGLFLNERDYAAIKVAKKREERNGVPLRLFGVDIHPRRNVALGNVQLATRDELSGR